FFTLPLLTQTYTLSLHDALPIYLMHVHSIFTNPTHVALREALAADVPTVFRPCGQLHRYSLRRSRWRKWGYLKLWGRMVRRACSDRKCTRLNSSHVAISYAVFCL